MFRKVYILFETQKESAVVGYKTVAMKLAWRLVLFNSYKPLLWILGMGKNTLFLQLMKLFLETFTMQQTMETLHRHRYFQLQQPIFIRCL